MAYQQTNATSIADLIDKIVTFAVANGWTADRNSLAGSARTATLHKSGDYINLWNSDSTYLRVRSAVGYDGGLAPDSQPNVAQSRAMCNIGAGPFPNVFLFADSTPAEHVYCVVEITSGIFRHISFGNLVKIGSYTGGTFFNGSYHDPSNNTNSARGQFHAQMFSGDSPFAAGTGGVRADYDSNTNYIQPFNTNKASGGMGFTSDSLYSRTNNFYGRSINSWSGVTPLQPIKVQVIRSLSYWTPIGVAPNIRFCNMSRLQAGDEITVGSDVWKVFPWVRKGTSGTITDPYSAEHAFAYKKVV